MAIDLLLVLSTCIAVSCMPVSVLAEDSIRVGSWNVYYKALDDPFGRQAIVNTIDNANDQQEFDLFGVVEATGDTPEGTFPTWTNISKTLGAGGAMKYVTGHSGYETIALYYKSARWSVAYQQQGQFEPGRPYLLINLVSSSKSSVEPMTNSMNDIWVLLVHFNHYFIKYPNQIDSTVPGAVLASALQNASKATNKNISLGSMLIFGDFNEYQWEDMEQPFQPDAAKRMAPLWDAFFNGRMRDTTKNHSISCCTKWSQADRDSTDYTEWRFEYDHIFVSDDFETITDEDADVFLPYVYPGTATGCSDPACTGEAPPNNVTTTHQGSWHRAVHTTLTISGSN